MQSVRLFDRVDMEIDPPPSQHRPISVNEARAVVKNRIEERKLNNRIKLIQNENRFNCGCISELRSEAESIVNKIHLTTGYATALRNIKSAPAKLFEKSGWFPINRASD